MVTNPTSEPQKSDSSPFFRHRRWPIAAGSRSGLSELRGIAVVTLFSLAAHFPGEIVASFREHGFFSLFSRAAVFGLGSGSDVRFLQEPTWGDADFGGDSRGVAAQLSGGADCWRVLPDLTDGTIV